MILFYSQDYNGKTAILIDEEATHCVKVLRKSIGMQINVTNGRGKLGLGKIIEVAKSKVVVEIVEEKYFPPIKNQIQIAIAPTKSKDRIEFFVEKAVEIGVNKIMFFKSSRSEKRKINMVRMRKIAKSAMKQSLQFYMPDIEDIRPLSEILFIKGIDQKFIAHCLDPQKSLSKSLSKSFDKPYTTLVLIGPEGDFTDEEIKLSFLHGFTEVSLGVSRLRTETAGIVATSTMAINNDLSHN